MSLHDLKTLGADPDRNRPWYRDDSDMISGSVIFALVVGAVIVFGAIWYAMSDHSMITAKNPALPTSTTGQGGNQNLDRPIAPQSKLPPTLPQSP